MAYRILYTQRATLPVAAGTLLAGAAIFPTATAYAEEAPNITPKKPIYDDVSATPTPPQNAEPDNSKTVIATFSDTPKESSGASKKPTPTERLAVQIGRARLQLYKYSTQAEDAVNNGMSKFLDAETNFTKTIASLAPPKTSNEQVVPGLVYVLVATLAGSIISRRRNILVRATVPVLTGVATAWAVIPITMRNVSDLIWQYEKKYPAVADTHLKIREQAIYLWETGKAHSSMTLQKAEGLVDDAKGKVEGWVKEGK